MTAISEVTDSTITVIVPIEIRRRNGRPKIVLPENGLREQDLPGDRASGAVLRAIARAWDWRRRLDAGEAATLQDIANSEKVTVPFVSRRIRLAYLSPVILGRIAAGKVHPAVSIDELAAGAVNAWAGQVSYVLEKDS